MSTRSVQPPIIAAIWPQDDAGIGQKAAIAVFLALVGTAALWASAKINVPFWPVPMTMQTMLVLLIGAAYGWRLGAATVLLYLVEGAAGLPVFANTPERGIGMAYMIGPTGGYLVGFVVSAALVGWLAERGFCRTILGSAGAFTLGTIVIFALGVGWLAHLLDLAKAIQFGLTPFILGAVVKIALAVAIMEGAWRIARRRPPAGDA